MKRLMLLAISKVRQIKYKVFSIISEKTTHLAINPIKGGMPAKLMRTKNIIIFVVLPIPSSLKAFMLHLNKLFITKITDSQYIRQKIIKTFILTIIAAILHLILKTEE